MPGNHSVAAPIILVANHVSRASRRHISTCARCANIKKPSRRWMGESLVERSANEGMLPTKIQASCCSIPHTIKTLLAARTLLPDLHPNESPLPIKVQAASYPSSLTVKTLLAARTLLPDLHRSPSRSPSIPACCSSPALLHYPPLHSLHQSRLNRLISTPATSLLPAIHIRAPRRSGTSITGVQHEWGRWGVDYHYHSHLD